MGGGFPVRDRAHDNNHRREITMLIFVAPQGTVWQCYRSLEGPHITRGLHWLTVINDHKSGPSPTPVPTLDPNHVCIYSAEQRFFCLFCFDCGPERSVCVGDSVTY